MLFKFIAVLLCPDHSLVGTSGAQFRAAIFDLGGVFIDWNPRYLYRTLFPNDEAGMERFLAEVLKSGAWNDQMDAGKPFAEAIAELQHEHPQHAALIAAFWERWPEMLGEVNAETAQIVSDLRERKLRVYALSDWSAETFPFARTTVRELDLFDDIQISGEVRLTKPDPRTFAAAARRFKIEPTKTLFVDDIAANVEAARTFGFSAIQFTTARALRDELVRLGLLSS